MRFMDWETPPPSSPKEAPNKTRDETEQLEAREVTNYHKIRESEYILIHNIRCTSPMEYSKDVA